MRIERRGRPRKFKAQMALFWIAVFTTVAVCIALVLQDLINNPRIATASDQINTDKVMRLAQREASAEAEIAMYRDIAQIATASGRRQHLTKEEAKEMIRTTFPEKYRQRFEEITMKCENGKLDTHATNVNKGGSKDIGMAQINDRWHRERVERMFGMDFEIAMKIPLLNYIYAAYLVEHSGNFSLWACDKLV